MESSKKKKPFSAEELIFSFLILAAIITRLFWIGKSAYFINDQGRDLTRLLQIVSEKKLTLIGPATSFTAKFGTLYFGPYYYYFLLPVFLISKKPLIMTLIFPGLFILGLLTFIKIKQISFREKLVFLLLIIFSSVSLYSTRFLWNLNLAFLLSFILFSGYFLLEKEVVSSDLKLILFGFMSGAVFQIHYGMFFLYGSFFYLVFKKKKFLSYFIGFLLSFSPFILFDLRHNFILFKTGIRFTGLTINPVGKVSYSFSNAFIRIFDYYFPLIDIMPVMKIIFSLLVITFIIFSLIKRKTVFHSFLATAFILFIVSFLIFKRDFDYYLICFYIWFYLGLAITLEPVLTGKKIISNFLFTVFLVYLFFSTGSYFMKIDSRYGIEIQKRLSELIHKDARNNNIEKIRITTYPIGDDRKGIEYLLKIGYKDVVLSQEGKEYLICYSDCQKKITSKDALTLLNKYNLILYRSLR